MSSFSKSSRFAPRQRALISPAQIRSDQASKLLEALEEQVRAAIMISQRIETSGARLSFPAYRGFSDKLSQAESLCAIIGSKIEAIAAEDSRKAQALKQQVAQLEAIMRRGATKARRVFYGTLAGAMDPLPMGIPEMLRNDLVAMEKHRAELDVRTENKAAADEVRIVDEALGFLKLILKESPGILKLDFNAHPVIDGAGAP